MGWRDVPALRKALSDHSVNGYPVEVPIFREGFIVSEGSEIHGFRSYTVRPATPMPFNEYADAKGASDKKGNLEGWIRELEQKRIGHGMIPPHIWDILESGGMASWRDVQAAWLALRGCLDHENNVTCDSFSEEHIIIPVDKLRPGMMVEFADAKLNQKFPGKIVDVRGEGRDTIVFMESFEPIPFMDAPEAIEPELIKPGFYSQHTTKIGYGTYEAMRKAKIKLPAGKIEEDKEGRRDGEHYLLKEPMPISVIEEFCASRYPVTKEKPQNAACVWQCLSLFIVPIHPEAVRPDHNGGTFHPMPTTLAMSIEQGLTIDESDPFWRFLTE